MAKHEQLRDVLDDKLSDQFKSELEGNDLEYWLEDRIVDQIGHDTAFYVWQELSD